MFESVQFLHAAPGFGTFFESFLETMLVRAKSELSSRRRICEAVIWTNGRIAAW